MNERVSLCGIVRRTDRFLVGKRIPGGSQGGKWEFPGGKLEPGESAPVALAREFAEELAVDVSVGEKLFTGGFKNGEKAYRLEAWSVELISDRFVLTEHQEIRWATLEELAVLDLSDSDRQVFEFLRSQFPKE